MLTKQLPITRETKKLRNMVMRFVVNYPKMFKYTLGKRMIQTVLDLNKYIRRANEETDKTRRWRYICEVRYLIEDLEDLVRLHRELSEGTYKIGRSVAFIVTRPKLREVFAADFRDRIVHHLVVSRLDPLFLRHYNSYGIRRKVLRKINKGWWEYIYISDHHRKVSIKKKYKHII